MGRYIEVSLIQNEIKNFCKGLIDKNKDYVEVTEFNAKIQERIEKLSLSAENSCDGCRHYNNGDGDKVCESCCRNYEEDCYESL